MVAHTMCMSVAAELNIELIWTKITNAYGPGEFSPRFINTTLRKILNGEKLEFTSGSQNYDFIYIDDVAKAFYLIGLNGKPFCQYLIGSSSAKPLKEFILDIRTSVAKDNMFIFGDIPFTGVNLPLSVFDCSKTESDTSFKAQISFSNGIKKTMKWIIKMEDKAKLSNLINVKMHNGGGGKLCNCACCTIVSFFISFQNLYGGK